MTMRSTEQKEWRRCSHPGLQLPSQTGRGEFANSDFRSPAIHVLSPIVSRISWLQASRRSSGLTAQQTSTLRIFNPGRSRSRATSISDVMDDGFAAREQILEASVPDVQGGV